MKNDPSTSQALSVNVTCRQAKAGASFPASPMQAGLDSSLFSITGPLVSSPSLRNPCSGAAWATLRYQGICLAWFHVYGFHFPLLAVYLPVKLSMALRNAPGGDRFLLVMGILQPRLQLLSWLVCRAPAKSGLRENRGWESTRRKEVTLMLAALTNWLVNASGLALNIECKTVSTLQCLNSGFLPEFGVPLL